MIANTLRAMFAGGLLVTLVSAAAVLAQAPLPAPRVAALGECRLASGATIPDCRIAYREFGTPNADRTNTVLLPTWLLGRSDDWLMLLGTDGLVDTARYFVVVVDALGDGYSSSPSNTAPNARAVFADLTIGDMVESQYRLLTERLRIRRLRAVVGFSMGGMQAIEWAVRYPGFVDKVVPIAGSPRVGAFDRLLWTAMLTEIEDAHRSRSPADTVWSRLAHLEMLFLRTPAGLNAKGGDSIARDVAANARELRQSWDLEDHAAQLRAIRRYDVALRYGGDVTRAAAEVRARMLAVYSWDDHMVTAGPVAEFARLVRADTLSLRSPCGHVMMFCERGTVAAAVRAFIAQ